MVGLLDQMFGSSWQDPDTGAMVPQQGWLNGGGMSGQGIPAPGMLGLLGNPLFRAGLEIVARNNGRQGAGATIGGGLLAGFDGASQYRALQQREGLFGLQLQQAQRQAAAQDRLGKAFAAAGQPNARAPGAVTMDNLGSWSGTPAMPRTGAPTFAGRLQDPRVQEALFEVSPSAAISAYTKDNALTIVPKGGTAIDRTGRVVATGSPDTEYKERDLPITADRIQKQFSTDGGRTWQNVGSDYSRRDEFIIQEVMRPDGSMERVAYPRAAVAASMGSGYGGSGGTPLVPGAPSNSAPAGRVPGMGGAQTNGLGIPGTVLSTTPPKPSSERGLIQESQPLIEQVKGRLFGPNGVGVNRFLIGQMWANVPGTEGAEVRNQFDIAFMNMVYMKTGKAATAEELEGARVRYLPKPMDSEATIRNKIGSLETFIGGFAGTPYPGAGTPPRSNGAIPPLPPGFVLQR